MKPADRFFYSNGDVRFGNYNVAVDAEPSQGRALAKKLNEAVRQACGEKIPSPDDERFLRGLSVREREELRLMEFAVRLRHRRVVSDRALAKAEMRQRENVARTAQIEELKARRPTDELREAPLFLVHLAKEGEGYGAGFDAATLQGAGSFFVEGFDIEDAAGRARKIARYMSESQRSGGVSWSVARVEHAGIVKRLFAELK